MSHLSALEAKSLYDQKLSEIITSSIEQCYKRITDNISQGMTETRYLCPKVSVTSLIADLESHGYIVEILDENPSQFTAIKITF